MAGEDSLATVWSSGSAESWSEDFAEPPGSDLLHSQPRLFNGTGNVAAFVGQFFDPLPGSRFGVSSTPKVWLRDTDGTWRNLDHPTMLGGEYLEMTDGFAMGPDEVYVCGNRTPSPHEPPWNPVVTYWNGSVWTALDFAVPATDAGTFVCRGQVRGNIGFGAIIPGGVTEIYELGGGKVTPINTVPREFFEERFMDVRPMPGGRLLLTRLTRLTLDADLLLPDFRWQAADGTWRRIG